MHIPYVIDNIEYRLADVLNALLQRERGQQIDVATAYFSIRGFEQVRRTLPEVRRFRMLLGDQPQEGEDVGLRPDSAAYLRHELNAEPFTEATLRLVEELIRFLRREDVAVRLYLGHASKQRGRRRFLHAKCYLFYGGRGDDTSLFDHLSPIVGIVGSSNFTGPGLISNRELNLVHKTLLEEGEIDDPEARGEVSHHAVSRMAVDITPEDQRLLKSEVGARAIMDLSRWYEAQWQHAIDYKDQLIDLLENSKFGGREYTPYEIYMKALYEYFKDDLDSDFVQASTRSAIDLTEFQEDAVRKARRILAQYDGVIVADSVGLGKTWIGKKLLEDYAYHLRQKALVICPASLKPMWEHELRSASISAYVVTQERLASDDFDIRQVADIDVLLVDESHHFRNKRTKRYLQLENILDANGRRGRNGGRKKLILLSTCPYILALFRGWHPPVFQGTCPKKRTGTSVQVLNSNAHQQHFRFVQPDQFVHRQRPNLLRIGRYWRPVHLLSGRPPRIYRSRQYSYLQPARRSRCAPHPPVHPSGPEATIRGEKITWPQRRLHTIEYDLEATYEGFYKHIVRKIELLNLAHYNLETCKHDWRRLHHDLQEDIDALGFDERRKQKLARTHRQSAHSAY